jgi:formylglycine-generating enzyme required for sulfatase activity
MSFAWNDLVTVVNRTMRKLEVRVDGETVVLEPRSETKLPRFVAEMACRQHPVMGTEDPYNPRAFDMLVGVREWKHDCTPIEQSDSVERLDRSALADEAARGAKVVKGRASVASRRLVEATPPSNDVDFKAD